MAQWSPEELSYCSNVHPGETLAEVKANIARFIAPVRRERALQRLQAGLWLSYQASNALINSTAEQQQFADLLKEQGIILRSLNGFPYGNFHDNIVKEKVYLPHWGQRERLNYTIQLANLLAKFMPEDELEGTISTLPLGFVSDWTSDKQRLAEQTIAELLKSLINIERSSGKRIRVCLEMEPGCVLEKTSQLIDFFTRSLPRALLQFDLPEDAVERYLGVCFDVCHQAVMFEDIKESLVAITQAGIVIGKIQVSSAMRISRPQRAKALLKHYAEPRYLHQVSAVDEQGRAHFSSDLADALVKDLLPWHGEWRIHYHVPIQAEQLESDLLSTTREAIVEVGQFLADNPSLKPHLEVETYTWGVMPKILQPESDEQLITAIAQELNWLNSTLARLDLMSL